jgi:predicted site-specific integrase-resolvase
MSDDYAAWLAKHGYAAGAESVSVRDATRTGIAERTIRRYIADGILPTTTVRGRRGAEHRIRLDDLYRVHGERSGAIERVHGSPVADLADQVAALRQQLDAQQAAAAVDAERLRQTVEDQTRTIEALQAEQRDARHQMHQMHDQLVRALMPPQKAGFWRRLFKRGN